MGLGRLARDPVAPAALAYRPAVFGGFEGELDVQRIGRGAELGPGLDTGAPVAAPEPPAPDQRDRGRGRVVGGDAVGLRGVGADLEARGVEPEDTALLDVG